jgi:hypothetical protein
MNGVDRWVEGWMMNNKMNGWMESKMDGWTGRMVRWLDRWLVEW